MCCLCVFTAVCVHFGWVKCRAQILSMCNHSLSRHATFTVILAWLAYGVNCYLYLSQLFYLDNVNIDNDKGQGIIVERQKQRNWGTSQTTSPAQIFNKIFIVLHIYCSIMLGTS